MKIFLLKKGQKKLREIKKEFDKEKRDEMISYIQRLNYVKNLLSENEMRNFHGRY